MKRNSEPSPNRVRAQRRGKISPGLCSSVCRWWNVALVIVLALHIITISDVAIADELPSKVKITVHSRSDGLAITFYSQKPEKSFLFDMPETVLSSGDVRLSTRDLNFSHGQVTAKNKSAFTSFTFLIKPTAQETDRTYPALTRIGEAGFVIYMPYFLPRAGNVDVNYNLPKKYHVLSGVPDAQRGRRRELRQDGYVFVGPTRYSRDDGVLSTTAPNFPYELRTQISENTKNAVAFYGSQLGVLLAEHPRVVIAMDEPTYLQWHGDTTPGLMMSLRFHLPRNAPAINAIDLEHFVFHEAFHYWNGYLFNPPTDVWLSEGSAEYAAYVLQRELGHIDQKVFDRTMIDGLNSCVADLSTQNLGSVAGNFGHAPYSCGMVIQWIVDLETHNQTSGRNTIFSVWRNVFQKAAELNDKQYSVTDFMTFAFPSGDPSPASIMSNIILNDASAERWNRLPEILTKLGVKVELQTSDDADYRSATLTHLLKQSCHGGNFGFWPPKDGAIKLDTGESCGAFGNNPDIVAIEGFNLISDAKGAYASVQAKCAISQVIQFTRKSGQTTSVLCPEPMPAINAKFVLSSSR